jgi:hypothetical protein
MKKFKHIKLFESFVNEELNQGTKLSQALILHMTKEPSEKGPEMDSWEKDKKVYEKALKDYVKQYDVDVSFIPTGTEYTKSLSMFMNFPESFMSGVKRFFGFGKSKISLFYTVENLTDLTDLDGFDRGSDKIEERVSISIGVDRKNTPSVRYKSNEPGNFDKEFDMSGVDPNRSRNNTAERIDLDKEDAQMMCKLLQDINPYTKFKTPQILVDALNEQLEGDFKSNVERSQTEPGYKFVVLNRIVLK